MSSHRSVSRDRLASSRDSKKSDPIEITRQNAPAESLTNLLPTLRGLPESSSAPTSPVGVPPISFPHSPPQSSSSRLFVKRGRARSISANPSSRSLSPSVARTDPSPFSTGINSSGTNTPLYGTQSRSGDHSLRQWLNSPRKRIQEQEGWEKTRSEVALAVRSALGVTADVAHDILLNSIEILPLVPVPGLELAAKTLLGIWDSIQAVDINHLACLRLTERCATILLSVHDEIVAMGNVVVQELKVPILKLEQSFAGFLKFLKDQTNQPFYVRYLHRQDILDDLAYCDKQLQDSLDSFDRSVLLRILRRVIPTNSPDPRTDPNESLLFKVEDTAFSRLSNAVSLPNIHLTANSSDTEETEESIRERLRQVHEQENQAAQAYDTAVLKNLERSTIQAPNDMDVIRVFQADGDAPNARRVMLQALERDKDDLLNMETSVGSVVLDTSNNTPLAKAKTWPIEGGQKRQRELLDMEFLECGLEALRRLSHGFQRGLPDWAISKSDIEFSENISPGFASDVYKGTWRQRTVAVKVLAKTTQFETFQNELVLWKQLRHPNILELYGASNITNDPPWFFVTPYHKNRDLSVYLRGIDWRSGTKNKGKKGSYSLPKSHVDHLRMMHEVSEGMEYLHTMDILHGDLKASNILVDNQIRCLIADFGLSKRKTHAVGTNRLKGPANHHSVRWQAPEILGGLGEINEKTDIYAYALCCVEIITMGVLPWPMVDDDTVRKYVLYEKKRPSLPSTADNLGIKDLMYGCWHEIPSERPTFKNIVRVFEELRDSSTTAIMTKLSPRLHGLDITGSHTVSPPSLGSINKPLPQIPRDTYNPPRAQTISSKVNLVAMPLQRAGTSAKSHEPTVVHVPTPRSRVSSIVSTSSESADDTGVDDGGYISPAPANRRLAQERNERRYRYLLRHDYNRSLVLPLWSPLPVDLGAVGYLSKPKGTFVTLFNSSSGVLGKIPPCTLTRASKGKGKENSKKHAQSSEGPMPNAKDAVAAYTFPLWANHKSAWLCTENPVHSFVENVSDLSEWFKKYADTIIEIYGRQYLILREDLLLVTGTLNATNYALFVNHNHPDGEMYFNISSPQKPGKPWGTFSTELISHLHTESLAAPSDNHENLSASRLFASKVSTVGHRVETVLIARLRLKLGSVEPTVH